MKKLITGIIILVLILSGCSNEKKDNLSNIKYEKSNTNTNENSSNLNQEPSIILPLEETGGDDNPFMSYYPMEVESTGFIGEIVGEEALSKYINEVFEVTKFDEQLDPLTYRLIKYFDIPKETMLKYMKETKEKNEKIKSKDGFEITTPTFSEEIINALYLEDINQMRAALKNPFVLYLDEKFITIYTLFPMTVEELDMLSIDKKELYKFTKDVEKAMKDYGIESDEAFKDLYTKEKQLIK